MRHRKAGKSFGRFSSHRKALFKNLCISLVEHEQIITTLAKAKELRRYFEPLITVSKSDSVASRRYVFNKLRHRDTVTKLFTILGPRFQARPGGYVRVLKYGFRAGDNAPMAVIQLVERSENVTVANPVVHSDKNNQVDDNTVTSKSKKSTHIEHKDLSEAETIEVVNSTAEATVPDTSVSSDSEPVKSEIKENVKEAK